MQTTIPKSWQVKTLGEVCDIIMGQSPLGEKVIHKSQNTDSKALEFHQGKICFTDKFISESEVVTTDIRKIAPKDSILLCVRAPVGVVNITQRRNAIGRGLCALNLKDSSNDFLYFYLLTLNNYFNQKATGSTFSAINLDTIKNTKIPIPPLEIQRRIVKRLDEAFSRIENGTKHLKSAKDNLTKYKQGLLKSVFEGTLTQDCPLSQGESMPPFQSESITPPLVPSAREGEHYSCHTERSEVSKSKSVDLENHLDSSVAPLPQNDNDRNNLKVPSLCGGDIGVGSTRTHNVVDCHESANADSRNDENSPSFAGGQSSSPSLNTSGLSSLSPSLADCTFLIPPPFAEGARGWVNAHNGESANLPQGWTIKTLGEVCEINPKNKLDDNLEVSFIPMNLILDKFQNKFSYETKIWKNIKKGYTHLQNNCIALAKITPYFENGKCVVSDDLKNGYGAGITEIIILLPNTQKVFIKYIFYFLNTQNFIEQGKRNFKGTAGQLRISTDFVSNCKIPIPPLEIQRQIVAILEKHFTSADKVSAYIDSCLAKAKQLKGSLLKSAFAGELV